MRREFGFLVATCAVAMILLTMVAAGPAQDERPPQPFFQDFFSGEVTLQGVPAPAGAQLIACVGDCLTGFQSKPVAIKPGGIYTLEVNPADQSLIGLPVSFYLVNEFGRIQAEETPEFVGIFNINTLNLTFNDPLPGLTPTPTLRPTATLTPTAVLPVPGDTTVTAIPGLALIVGAGAVVSKDLPPYAVAAGMPARVMRIRP